MNRTASNRSSSRSSSTLVLVAALAAAMGAAGLASAAETGVSPRPTESKAAAKKATGGKKQPIAVGWLSGVVRDEYGERVPSATITISLPGGGQRVEQTDTRGRFHIGNLPDSKQSGHTYSLLIQHCEFGESEASATVIGGSDQPLDITLKQWPWMSEAGGEIIGWCPVGPDWSEPAAN